MKKYTIKEFAEGKKAVKIESEEQWNKLNNVHRLCGYYGAPRYYTNSDSHSDIDSDFYRINDWEVLEFSQLDFEDEFVVGKWYKITKEGVKTKYIKYLNTNLSGYFLCRECIHSKYHSHGGTFGINNAKDLEEISLEEIQQYLPSGHPDLIKQDTFVLPEKWKVLITDESKETLEKHRLTLPKQTSDIHSILCSDAHGKFYLSTDEEFSDYQFWGVTRLDYYTEITFEQFKTHVLKENTINTFGLKVGDHLPKEVISEWVRQGKNRWIEGGVWHTPLVGFDRDRVIEGFKICDGVIGMLVSDTDNLYLRCEGFKEFKENFNKEKEMEKEIIGWKLVKPEYNEAALKIANLVDWGVSYRDKKIDAHTPQTIERLKEAGVLDLWFKAVYAPEFKVGEWVTWTITPMVTGKIVKYNNDACYALDVKGNLVSHDSCHRKYLRKATEEEIKKASISLPKINGKQCVDNGDKTITCGCTTKSFDWILGVFYAMDYFIMISETKITYEEMKQIVEYINNK